MVPTRGPMGGVRPNPREVVVGIQCGEAVLRGADVFAPGLFGSPKGDNQHTIGPATHVGSEVGRIHFVTCYG